MAKYKSFWAIVIGVVAFSLLFLILYFKFNTNGYLPFSDAAKVADIARNMISGLGYNGKFSFWSSGIVNLSQKAAFPSPWMPPLMPFSIALAFKIFGVSDFSVMATSSIYFVLLTLFIFLLGRKLFGNLVGTLSAVAVATNIDFLNYATNGSSESLFTVEIVAAVYFISLKKKWATAISFLLMAFSYFTRPQGFIYIAGLLFYWLLINFKTQKALLLFALVLLIGFGIDYFVLPNFAGKYFLYSVMRRGIGTAAQISAGGSASDSLRGEIVMTSGIIPVLKKLFYNLYNFYKLLPEILSPYLAGLFVIGLFKWDRSRSGNSLKVVTTFMVFVTFFVTALSIPFFRYIHPVVPLVYLFAVETLVWIVAQIFKQPKYLILTSSLLILVFVVGQTLGVIFLDSRFIRNTHNVGKPPIYVALSRIAEENTKPSDFILTNLDTWASWYGDRRTIWYPVMPKQLIDPATGKITVDAIFLTSYLMDDQNYYMGQEWREIFDNPSNFRKWTCEGGDEIAREFKLKAVYMLNSDEDYEGQTAKAILLIKK